MVKSPVKKIEKIKDKMASVIAVGDDHFSPERTRHQEKDHVRDVDGECFSRDSQRLRRVKRSLLGGELTPRLKTALQERLETLRELRSGSTGVETVRDSSHAKIAKSPNRAPLTGRRDEEIDSPSTCPSGSPAGTKFVSTPQRSPRIRLSPSPARSRPLSPTARRILQAGSIPNEDVRGHDGPLAAVSMSPQKGEQGGHYGHADNADVRGLPDREISGEVGATAACAIARLRRGTPCGSAECASMVRDDFERLEAALKSMAARLKRSGHEGEESSPGVEARLREDLRTLRADHEKLQTQVKTSSNATCSQCHKLHAQISHLEETNSRLRERLGRALTRSPSPSVRRNSPRSECMACSRLRHDYEAVQKMCRRLEDENWNLNTLAEDLRNEIRHARQSSVDSATAQMDKLVSARSESEGRVLKMKNSLAQKDAELEDTRRHLDDSQARIVELENENLIHKSDLEEMSEKVMLAEDDARSMKAQMKKLNDDLSNAIACRKRVEDDHSILRARSVKYENEIKVLSARYEAVCKDISKIRDCVDLKGEELEEAKKVQYSLRDEISSADSSRESLRSMCEQLQRDLDGTRQEKSALELSLKTKIQELCEEIVAKERSIEDATLEVGLHRSAADQLRESEKKSRAARALLEVRLEEVEESLRDAQAQHVSASSEVESLKKSLEARDTDRKVIEELARENERVEVEYNAVMAAQAEAHSKEREELLEKRREAEKALADQQNAFDGLLRDIEDELNQARSEYNKQQEALRNMTRDNKSLERRLSRKDDALKEMMRTMADGAGSVENVPGTPMAQARDRVAALIEARDRMAALLDKASARETELEAELSRTTETLTTLQYDYDQLLLRTAKKTPQPARPRASSPHDYRWEDSPGSDHTPTEHEKELRDARAIARANLAAAVRARSKTPSRSSASPHRAPPLTHSSQSHTKSTPVMRTSPSTPPLMDVSRGGSASGTSRMSSSSRTVPTPTRTYGTSGMTASALIPTKQNSPLNLLVQKAYKNEDLEVEATAAAAVYFEGTDQYGSDEDRVADENMASSLASSHASDGTTLSTLKGRFDARVKKIEHRQKKFREFRENYKQRRIQEQTSPNAHSHGNITSAGDGGLLLSDLSVK